MLKSMKMLKTNIYLACFVVIASTNCTSNAKIIVNPLPGKVEGTLKCSIPVELGFTTEQFKIIGVFTTWDLKSQIMMNRFRKTRAFFKKKSSSLSFNFIFIDTDSRMVDNWYKSFKPDFTTLYDKDFRFCRKKTMSVPTMIIMNKKRHVCYIYSGVVTSDTLAKQIEDSISTCR